MKRFFIIALIVISVFSVQSVFAQANDKMLEEFLKVAMVKEQFDETVNMMMSQQSKAFAGQGKIPDEVAKVLQGFYKKYLTWETVKNDMTKAYSETFTQEEIQAMIKFYSTPAGQSIVKKQPQLTQKIMLLTMASMQKHMPELQASLMEIMKKKQPAK
ncbi:MAG: hypothetical protein A2017_12605 [Lentisphaerae bacterium GWF2_44_16]|nr:MAG: hypothetical protein A2017_12605 [Lentisphaerae bacterium GWF2_44_16]